MSFLKKILVLTIFLFSTNIVFIENTNSKEKVLDGISDLTFKFPKDKNFVSKYKCITKSDKNKNSSSFIYEIGQNQMKMRANDIATLLVDFESRTYRFEGYKLNEKDRSFLREQNFDEIVQTVLSEYLDFNILKNNRRIQLGKKINFKHKRLFMGLNTEITQIPKILQFIMVCTF